MRILIFFGALLIALPASAAETTPGITGSNIEIAMDVILGLGVTILCIYLLSAAAKRLLGGTMQGQGALRVVTGISVGTRERILVVEVDDEQLLIGVSPAGISRLHQLDSPIAAKELSAPALPSALTQLMRGGREA